MKKVLLFLLPLALLGAGCLVAVPKEDRGKKQGWYKNRNNPHHQADKKKEGKK